MSGRLVPVIAHAAVGADSGELLSIQWTFGFPIEALIGNLAPTQLLYGLGAQLFGLSPAC